MSSEHEFFVAPNGNDAGSGARPKPGKDGPFATLRRARDAVRTLKAGGRLRGPVTIAVRGGVYRLPEPLVFTAEDSGTDDAPITYAAYENEPVTISGGSLVRGWRATPGGLWCAAVDKADLPWTQLFVNGRRAERARMPHHGFYYVDGSLPTRDQPPAFRYQPGDLRPGWAERGDAEIVFLQNWIDERMLLRALDPERRLATLSSSPRPLETDGRYWVENVREGLSEPGAWFYDARAGRVYYRSLAEGDPADAEFVAPRLLTLVQFEGDEKAPVSNVTLRGLTFQHTAWVLPADGFVDPQAAISKPAAVTARGAVRCQIDQCRFERLGGYAVEFGAACHANRITRCEMSDVGGGGVKLGAPKLDCDIADPAVSSGNVVEDCHIQGIGRVYPAAVGVWIGQSCGNRVAHNHIHDTYYTGVSLGWTWGYGRSYARDNIIEFNHIHHIGQGMLSDMGGIYSLGIQPGTVLRNNLIHDVTRQPRGYGGWGIYTDEGSAEILIENNVVYRCESGGFHQHYGRENVLRNNIFAWAQEGQMVRTREEAHASFTLERNLILCDGESPLTGAWLNGRFASDRNLFFVKNQTAFHATTIYVGIKPFPSGFLPASRADDAVTLGIGAPKGKPEAGGLRVPQLPDGITEPTEALWTNAVRLPDMVAASGGTVPMADTDVRLLRDAQTLFIKAECLHSRTEDRDAKRRAIRRDILEVLLRPDRAKPAVIHFIVFSDGERKTHFHGCVPRTGMVWTSSASRTATGWTAILSLPIQDIVSACGGSTPEWSVFVGRSALLPAMSFADWQALGHDTHSLLTDPLFADADAEDWRLRDDSPALAIGFRPIELGSVGPRKQD